jgi:hypothetical protein
MEQSLMGMGPGESSSYHNVNREHEIASIQEQLKKLRGKSHFGPDDQDEVRFLSQKLETLGG